MNLFKKSSSEDLSTKKRNMRRLRFGTLSTVLTAVVVVVFILLNLVADTLADRYPLSWDLTAEGAYTLSEECTKVAETTDKEIEVVLFVGKNTLSVYYESMAEYFAGYLAIDLSAEFNRLTRELETALAQITASSGDKIRYSFLDPNQNPAEFAAYEKYEVTSGDILFIAGDRHRTSNLQELFDIDLSTFSTTGNYYFSSLVEKVFASKIYALQGESDRIVQVLTGHKENQNTIAGLKTLYELNGFIFEEIDITASKEFNPNAELMLIAAPTTDYSDAEIKKVQEWIFNDNSYGHNLIVFTDTTASCPNLYELLDIEYGIQVTDELIWETDSNRIFESNNYYMKSEIPETRYTKNSVGSDLYTPTARRLTTTWESEKEQENTLANLGILLNNYSDSAKVMKLNKAQSNDAKDAITPDESEYPLTSMIAAFIDSYNNNTGEIAQGSVVVCGCPDLASLENIQNNSFSNEALLLDVVDTLAGIENEVTISSKQFDQTYLTYEIGAQNVMRYIFVVGIPAVVLVVCLVIFLRRKYL